MDFERSDGVILNISDCKDGMQVIMIYPDEERGVVVSKSIFHLADLAIVIEAADSGTEAAFHEQAVWVAGRIQPPTESSKQLHESLSRFEKVFGSISEPCYLDSGPKSTLIAHHLNLCNVVDLIDEVDKKRTSSLTQMDIHRNREAVLRLRKQRTEFAQTACNQATKEIEAESTYKDSMWAEKCLRDMHCELVGSIETVRNVNIETKLRERRRTQCSAIERLLSETRMQQTHRDAIREQWRKAAMARGLAQRAKIQQANSRMIALERIREINIEKRQEQRRINQKQYVAELRNSKKQLERKRVILHENRQALAHDLFASTLYYLIDLSGLYSIVFILTRVGRETLGWSYRIYGPFRNRSLKFKIPNRVAVGMKKNATGEHFSVCVMLERRDLRDRIRMIRFIRSTVADIIDNRMSYRLQVQPDLMRSTRDWQTTNEGLISFREKLERKNFRFAQL